MSEIKITDLSFAYKDQPNRLILKDINIEVEHGEFVCLLGPSGCGKSTFLRLLAGLEDPTGGTLEMNGKPLKGSSLDRSVVFQDYGLFPWMTAGENIMLALQQKYPKKPKKELKEVALNMMKEVGLDKSVFKKLPKALSGGMKQRCAIARSLSIDPPILLMDEPFGALDAVTRAKLQDLLISLWNHEEEKKTVFFVTHDVDESMLLANRILVFGQSPSNIIYDKKIPEDLKITRETMEPSFDKAQISYEKEIYAGFPSYKKIEILKKSITDKQCDVLVGIGGGRIMDLTKAAADQLSIPIVLIPTSAATCASFSPLSVIYTDEGKCVGYLHFDYEVNAVLVDEKVMSEQPPRLLAAGIMDAMAKYIEIANGKPKITLETDNISKYSAYRMAEDIYNILEKYGKQAYLDVCEKKNTETVHNVIFCNIALTGIVSALMRARRQTAIAHKLYESMRTYYFKESINYLHGEIVATGLIAQLRFNHNTEAIERLKQYMKEMEMPINLQDLGLQGTEDEVKVLFDVLKQTEFVEDTNEAREELAVALKEIY